MSTPPNEPADALSLDASNLRPTQPAVPIAPVWHTVVLVAAVVLLSLTGANQMAGDRGATVNRFGTYGLTVGTELLMVAWVYLGLRLRKIPFRSLFGSTTGGLRTLAIDLGSAFVFWIASLMILGTIGLFWTATEAAIKHHSLIPHAGQSVTPDASEQHTLRTLTALVPRNAQEVAAWVLLCMVAGFAEELVFRGYFQRQFAAWSRGSIVAGVAVSAALFGAAHGYQGVRNMLLLAVFGALFSLLTLFRRNLRAAMFAHSWHDLVAGLLLAFLNAHHRI